GRAVGDFLQISTRRKRPPAFAADYQNRDGLFFRQIPDCRSKCGPHDRIDGIMLVRPVEQDGCDPPFALDEDCIRHERTEAPPSMTRLWPLTYSEAGVARNSAALAMSCGVPRRTQGVCVLALSIRSGSEVVAPAV